jgi:hypothetical protein
MIVVEQLGVIDWSALEGSGAAAADRKQLGGSSLGPLAAPDALKAFPKGFGHRAGHGFAGLLGERLSELVGFGVFDVQGHGLSRFLLGRLLSTCR